VVVCCEKKRIGPRSAHYLRIAYEEKYIAYRAIAKTESYERFAWMVKEEIARNRFPALGPQFLTTAQQT